MNADVQTERLINKMKRTVAYHCFADNLENSLKIEGRNRKYSFHTGSIAVRSKHIYRHSIGRHLRCVLRDKNSIFTLEFRNYEFHSCILRYCILLHHYHFLPDTAKSKSFCILVGFYCNLYFPLILSKNTKCSFSQFRECPKTACKSIERLRNFRRS